jgi:Kelch motif
VVGVAAYVGGLAATNPRPRSATGWSLLAPLPTARGETAAAVADGRLYVIGGMTGLAAEASAEVSVYDPTLDAWTQAPALPAPRHHAAAVGLSGTVYVSGGRTSADETSQATFWALAAGAASWEVLAPMPEGRYGHRMVAVGDRLYVVGGVGATGRVLVYDVAADAWQAAREMPSPRNHLGAVVVDGEIWAIGGRLSGHAVARVDIYTPLTDAWRSGPPLPEVTSGASEGLVRGVILISGGEDPSSTGGVIDRHWQLDTGLGPAATWEPLDAPPLAVHGAHGASIDGRFFIVGGALRPGAYSRLSWTDATQAYPLP